MYPWSIAEVQAQIPDVRSELDTNARAILPLEEAQARGAAELGAMWPYMSPPPSPLPPRRSSRGRGGAIRHSVAPLPERQQWIWEQVLAGAKLERAMVQRHFGISEKQAKRELAALSARGLIEFRRKPHPGSYVLAERDGE